MKKVMFALAAVAMMAFVGCNKNETITVKVTGGDSDKSGWYNYENQVVFEANADEAYINGGLYTVVPTTDDGSLTGTGYSRNATIELNGEMVNLPAIMAYPSTVAWMDDPVNVSVSLNPVVSHMPYPSTAEGYVSSLSTGVSEWPLVAYLPNVQNGCTFRLMNTTALINPSVKFGYDFCASLMTANRIDFIASKLVVNKVYLMSDVALAGNGYVEHVTSANDATPECNAIITDDATNTVEATPDVRLQFTNYLDAHQSVGGIAVPKMATGDKLQMVMWITLSDNAGHEAQFTYTSALGVNGTNIQVARSRRTTIVADFYSQRADFSQLVDGHIVPVNNL